MIRLYVVLINLFLIVWGKQQQNMFEMKLKIQYEDVNMKNDFGTPLDYKRPSQVFEKVCVANFVVMLVILRRLYFFPLHIFWDKALAYCSNLCYMFNIFLIVCSSPVFLNQSYMSYFLTHFSWLLSAQLIVTYLKINK